VYPFGEKKVEEVVTSRLPHPIAAASDRRIETCDVGCRRKELNGDPVHQTKDG